MTCSNSHLEKPDIAPVGTALFPDQELDQRGFAQQLIELGPFLSRRAYLLTQDESEAEDLVQQTLERALLNQNRFRAGTNVRAWTTSIMRNLFIDDRRRMHHRHRATIDTDKVAAQEYERGILDLLSDDDVRTALAGLGEDDRTLFDLAYSESLSYRQIAVRFGIRISTVGTRLFRIRAKVRATLQRACPESIAS